MSFPPDKYRDEDDDMIGDGYQQKGASPEYADQGVNDDGGEWSPEPFLDSIGDEPITLERLIEFLSTEDIGIFDNLKVPVPELLERIKAAKG